MQKGQEHVLDAQAALKVLHKLSLLYGNEEQHPYLGLYENELARIGSLKQSANKFNKKKVQLLL
mgnify:CR=1 FL=1